MIFVGLLVAIAMLLFAGYNAINPKAAYAFWVRNVTGRPSPWINADDPDYAWTMRAWGIVGIVFFGLAIYGLTLVAIGGKQQ